MEHRQGMVAVVRGLGDQGISVTLMDGDQRFTLAPNNDAQFVSKNQMKSPQNHNQSHQPHQESQSHHCCSQGSPRKYVTHAGCSTEDNFNCCVRKDSGVQATDGRYTSTYRASHCHVAPTSPEHHQVTEFPPQRPGIQPGHGNFIIGGTGSGETSPRPQRLPTGWSERTETSPKQSRQPDSFARSLRQYPCSNISPERSTEIIEKLINYTQSKNADKTASRYSTATSRVANIDLLKQNKAYFPSLHYKSPNRSNIEEKKQTRENNNKCDVFQRNYNSRFIKNYSLYEQLTTPPAAKSKHTKSTEIQVGVVKVSKKLGTSPLPVPEKRSVALITSGSTFKKPSNTIFHSSVKSVSIATNSYQSLRKSKSHDVILSNSAEELRVEILDWFENIPLRSSLDPNERHLRYNLLKRLKAKLDNMAIRCQNQAEVKCESRNEDVVNLVQNINYTNIRPGFIECTSTSARIDGVGRQNNTGLLILEICNTNEFQMDEFAEEIASWIQTVKLNPTDKQKLLSEVVNKLKRIAAQRPECIKEYKSLLKGELMDILDLIHLKLVNCNKTVYKHRIADQLINKLVNIPVDNSESKINSVKISENEVKEFVREEVSDYLYLNHLEMKPYLFKYIECDLTDILMKAINEMRLDKEETENLIGNLLQEYFELNKIEALEAAQYLVNHFQIFLQMRSQEEIEIHSRKSNAAMKTSGTFLVYRSKSVETMKSKNALFSMNEISSSEIKKMVDNYVEELSKQINEWLIRLSGEGLKQNKKLRETAVHDLATDIVDRKRYLEMNPCKISEEEELEYLKYQIFKWISKFVDNDKKSSISHAADLLKRIQSIPVPVLHTPQKSSPETNVDVIIKEVREWLKNTPTDLVNYKDVEKHIKEFAETLDKKLKSKHKNHAEIIDKQVTDFCKKVMKANNDSVKDDLQLRIKKSQMKEEEKSKLDLRLIKSVIRNLEDLIDEWLETFPEQILIHENFSKDRYKRVHDLATTIAEERKKGQKANYHDEIVNWMKKLPNQPKDKKVFRDQFAKTLLNMILYTDLERSVSDVYDVQNTQKLNENQIEEAIMEWLKNTALYKESDDVDKAGQEYILRNLAGTINALKTTMRADLESNLSNVIITHIKHLPVANGKRVCCKSQDFIKDLSMQLKVTILRQLSSENFTNSDAAEFLETNVSLWIEELPLTDESNMENKKKEFITQLKRLSSSCCSNAPLRTEIKSFLKTLPIVSEKHSDNYFMDKETEKLLIKLSFAPVSYERNYAMKNIQTETEGTNEMSSTIVDKHQHKRRSVTLKNIPLNTTGSKRNNTNDTIVSAAGPSIINIESPMVYLNEWVEEIPVNKYKKKEILIKAKTHIETIRADSAAMNNKFLFEDLLESKIDNIFDGLEQTPELTSNRHILKVKLINIVTEENDQLNINALQRANYKEQLKDSLSKILPDDLNTTSEMRALDELAKDDFIDNFIKLKLKEDDGFHKLVYKDRITEEIKKVFEEYSQKNRGKSTNAKKLQENIYEAMNNVPIPTKDEVQTLIKEMAIKQDVSDWYNELPVISTNNPNEQLEIRRRKSFLAKKIVELEKLFDEPEPMVKNAIFDWLEHAPLKTQQDIEFHVNELTNRIAQNEILNFSRQIADRKKSVEFKSFGYQTFSENVPMNSSAHSLNVGQNAKQSNTLPNNGSSCEKSTASGSSYKSILEPCCKSRTILFDEPKLVSQSTQSSSSCFELKTQRRKVKSSSDALYETVTAWCNQISGKEENGGLGFASKLILRLSEIIKSSEILEDEFIFNNYVENAIDNALGACPNLGLGTKGCLKKSMLRELRLIRDLARNEQRAQNFRKEICDTITKTVPLSCNSTALEDFKDRMGDLLIEINFDPSMDKTRLVDEIGNFFSATQGFGSGSKTQIKGQLYDALLAIRPPNKEALQDEIETIKIKNKIAQWMDNLPIINTDGDKIRKIKTILAKQVHEIEKDAESTSVYDEQMVAEVMKWLRKVPLECGENKIEEFCKELIQRLKATAYERTDIQERERKEEKKDPTIMDQNSGVRHKCRCSTKSRCKKCNSSRVCFVALYPFVFR